MEQWIIRIKGHISGPFVKNEILEMIESNRLSAKDEVNKSLRQKIYVKNASELYDFSSQTQTDVPAIKKRRESSKKNWMKDTVILDPSLQSEEPEKEAILGATAGSEAKAPGCLRWEIGNAFSAMVKRGWLNERESLTAMSIFETIPVQEVDVDMEGALALALKHHIYAYDAYYLMAAKSHRVALLTLDSKMSDVARAEGINLMEIQ